MPTKYYSARSTQLYARLSKWACAKITGPSRRMVESYSSAGGKFSAPLAADPFEFSRDFRRQKTTVPGLVTNKQTDTGRELMPALTSVTQVKKIIITGLQKSDIITHHDCVPSILSYMIIPYDTITYIYVNPKADE